MAIRNPEANWIDSGRAACLEESCRAGELIEELREAFTHIHVAADFLLLEMEPGEAGPQLQLACLIKEKLVTIQEQVHLLCEVLSRGGISTCPSLEQ